MSQPGLDPVPADPCKLQPEDLPDIQGFVVRGYNMPKVRHFVLTIGKVNAALRFLGDLTSGPGPLKVTSAVPWPGSPKPKKPSYALNIGLTAEGLEALKLPGTLSINPGNFRSFLRGAVAQAGVVGDTGDNAPDNWVQKLNSANADRAHVLLSLYTNTGEDREFYSRQLEAMFADVIPPPRAPGNDVLKFDVDPIITPDRYRTIHFGYVDGISNPIIDAVYLPPLRPNQLPYVPAWQFVTRDGAMTTYNLPQPLAFGQNGSFSAFRILEQNVPAFDAYTRSQGPDQVEFLAGKLCGRWRNGNPVELRPDSPGEQLPDDELTDFDYGSDNVGEPCPYSAHTRRANPRGGPGVVGVSDKVSNRIMRRADAYGPAYTGSEDGQKRGLAGHFMCAMLFNQFEFIMSQWVNGDTFPGTIPQAGIDPLLGKVPPGSTFTYWKDDQPVHVDGLSRFVTTKGGLYCFIPSITALQWMARNGNASDPWIIPPT